MKTIKLIFGIAAVSTLFVLPPKAHADYEDLVLEIGCGSSSLTSYTAALKVPSGEYNVYVRVGEKTDEGLVNGYARYNDSGNYCQTIGQGLASSTSWTFMGVVKSPSDSSELLLQLQTKNALRLDANRPSYMLIPKDQPICEPTVECFVTVNGQSGYVRPAGAAPNRNAMFAVRAVDPASDTLRSVRYYASNDLVYTKSTLEPFDLRYVQLPRQQLTRVAEYASHQQIVFNETSPDTLGDDFGKFIFRIQQRNDGILTALIWLVTFLLAYTVVFVIVSLYRKRTAWLLHHGLRTQPPLTPARVARVNMYMKIKRIASIGAKAAAFLVGVIATIYVSTQFLVLLTTIEGKSMTNTYKDGQHVVVNRIPKTIASINRLQYIPKRGEVVVAFPQYGILDSTSEEEIDSTVIKRVIGLPNERIVIENGTLKVYNKEHPEGFEPDTGSSWADSMIKDTKVGRLEITLKNSEVFLSGDNRPGSIDSRFNGPINVSQILGPVWFVW